MEAKVQKLVKHNAKNGLPAWWNPSLDYYFLVGCDLYGCSRGDLYFQDEKMPFKNCYQSYMQLMGFKDEYAGVGESEQVKAASETKYWMKDIISIKWLENIITALERGPRGGPRKPKLPRDGSAPSTPRSLADQLHLPHFMPTNPSRTGTLMQRESGASSSQNMESTPGKPRADSGSEDTDALIARANTKIKKYSKKLDKIDLDHYPQIPIYPDDDKMIEYEIQKLRELYAQPTKRLLDDAHTDNTLKKPKIEF